MGRQRSPEKQQQSLAVASMARNRARSPAKLRRRIAVDPCQSGIAAPGSDLTRSMPALGLSPVKASPAAAMLADIESPSRRRSSSSRRRPKGSPVRGHAVLLQQANGDLLRVRLERRSFGALVAAAVPDGAEAPEFYWTAGGERCQITCDAELEAALNAAAPRAPRLLVKTPPPTEHERTGADLKAPSNWDTDVYPGSPMLQMADYDATRERLRRPKPTNPYYDGPVGCLQQSTAARPFINDPDPDHPSFTASRLRRSPILCAKQKRGMQTPLPYSLPSFGPAGGQHPRHGHGKQPQQAPCPKCGRVVATPGCKGCKGSKAAPKDRLVHTRGSWTMLIPVSRPAIDHREHRTETGDHADATAGPVAIHVGGLEGEWESESKLAELFGRYGTVVAVTLRKRRQQAAFEDKKVSWALVSFSTLAEAELALVNSTVDFEGLGAEDLVTNRLNESQLNESQGAMGRIWRAHTEARRPHDANLHSVAAAVQSLSRMAEPHEPLETIRMEKKHDLWDEFAELCLEDDRWLGPEEAPRPLPGLKDPLKVTRFGEGVWSDQATVTRHDASGISLDERSVSKDATGAAEGDAVDAASEEGGVSAGASTGASGDDAFAYHTRNNARASGSSAAGGS